MNMKAAYGYEVKDGSLVKNEMETSIIKWIYKKSIEYNDNPPDFLIKKAIDRIKEERSCAKKEISYDEAKQKAAGMANRYVTAELNIRLQQYKDKHAKSDEIQEFLEFCLDKKLIAAVEKEFRTLICGVSPTFDARKAAAKKRPFSEFSQKFKPYNLEPIIMEGVYEGASEKIKG